MNSTVDWGEDVFYPSTQVNDSFWSPTEIAAVTVLCVLIPFILGGNLLVIIAVLKYRRLQSTTNYFLVSLAVADICTGLFAPVHIIAEVFKDQITNPVLCLGPHCLLMTVCGASILCLASIAYDRYTALTKALEYIHIMTVRKMVAFTVFAWVYSAGVAWLPLMGLHHDIETTNGTCTFHLIQKEPLIVLMAGLFLPAYLIIFFCYARIFCIARRHVSAIAAVQISLHQQIEMNFMAKDKKYAKTLGIVMGFFVVLWLPYQICVLIELVSNIVVDDWLRDYLALMSYCNSGINPWIYTFRNQEFKRAFLDILSQWCGTCKFGASRRNGQKYPYTFPKPYLDNRHNSCAPSPIWSIEGSDDSRRNSNQRQPSIATTTTTSLLDITIGRRHSLMAEGVSSIQDESPHRRASSVSWSMTEGVAIDFKSPEIIINICENLEDNHSVPAASDGNRQNRLSLTPELVVPSMRPMDYLTVPKNTYRLFSVMNTYSQKP